MNALERYFAETKDKPSRLAIRIGRSPSTLTRVLKGERDPSMRLARDVEKETGGQVSASDFLSICLHAATQREAS